MNSADQQEKLAKEISLRLTGFSGHVAGFEGDREPVLPATLPHTQEENACLKKIVAEQALDIDIVKEVSRKDF